MIFFTVKAKPRIIFIALLLSLMLVVLSLSFYLNYENNIYSKVKNTEQIYSIQVDEVIQENKTYIKWVDFNVPYSLLEKALKYDINSYQQEIKLNWVELLAYCGAKCGGNFSTHKSSTLDGLVARLRQGEKMETITADMKHYSFYLEVYGAVLGNFVGEYEIQTKESLGDGTGEETFVKKYGLKVFSPIAKGYSVSHYKDFGVSRSYGYRRQHLGHDLMGSIGTPIIAVEDGIIEAMGWNAYGGWRIGIRSLDKKRYYYYAHMRKDHPFHYSLNEGDTVKAGDVIGYLGMSGYSTKENVNNMTSPHLHFGMQLIFDESQKESTNQIWIDVYNIYLLLQKNKSEVYKNEETKDYSRLYEMR